MDPQHFTTEAQRTQRKTGELGSDPEPGTRNPPGAEPGSPRRRTLFILAMTIACLGISGCTTWEALWGNVRGPISGKLMSPEEASAEARQEAQRLAAEAKAKTEEELAAARARKADFELAAARLSGDCELKLRELANQYDRDEAAGQARLAGIDSWLRDKNAAIDAGLTRTLAKYEQDRGAIGALVDAVAGPASMLPWGATALTGLLAVTGFRRAGQAQQALAAEKSTAQAAIRAEADKAWTEAKAEEKEAAAERDRHYDMGAIEALKNHLLSAGLAATVGAGAAGSNGTA